MTELRYRDLDRLFEFYQKKHRHGGQLTRSEVKFIENFLFEAFYKDDKPKYKIIEV